MKLLLISNSTIPGEPYLDYPKNEFITRLDLQLQAERLFEVLSQIILDVCTHIIANSNIQAPKSYSECITKLSELNIIPKEKVSTFSSLIKMRHLVVHQYSDISYNTLYDALNSLIHDFKDYQTLILSWLDEIKK